ncbi:uncharacterized protein BDZ99DRAFT_514351 [Mytilinidion resinicola]|uniref:Uncharacterized protein n=1 Tax=Mytilinidion resinicola TaxID=574789 RepID=A0A6A6Z3P7_9PEZI|nr:uncharacterized protein BDZ99DRAFT_514351 [Mytilinidion resinicola]KAF2815706.1 hypothetical protein BDZ99DRAFT_514351 [Mytilinidion resinicola]
MAPGEGPTVEDSPGEGSTRAAAADAASSPPSPTYSPPRQLQDTPSSIMSVSDYLPGFYQLRIHGSCPNCKHWHRTATAQISRDPAKFSGVRCEKCNKRWFGIGGNASHPSLASVNTLPEAEWIESPSYSALRNALLVNVQTLSAVGSGSSRLGPVAEENTSPISHRPGQALHSRNPSSRSNVHPRPSPTKVPENEEKAVVQEVTPPDVKRHQVKPSQTVVPEIEKPKATHTRSFDKAKSRVKQFKKKFEKVTQRMRSGLTSLKKKTKRSKKGKEKIDEPKNTQAVRQEEALRTKPDITEDKGVADTPKGEGQPEGSVDTSSGKGKAKEEPLWPGSTNEDPGPADTNGIPSPEPSPPLSDPQARRRRRDAEIDYVRKELTKLSACTCGPNCGPECRCRHHGRPVGPFHPRRSQDDSSIDYYSHPSNPDAEPPIPQLPQTGLRGLGGLRNSADFDYFGVQFEHSGSESHYPGSIASGLSNRVSIGAITIATTHSSSNFSTARTYVGSEGMTATSPPITMLRPRPQSLPRPHSRSPRIASASPPTSPLRVSTFARARDSYASSTDDRDDDGPVQDGLDEFGTTPTQHNYIEALRSFQEHERGRTFSQTHGRDNDSQQGDAIARHDHAPIVNGHAPMVNGHEYERRLSEPTSSTA